METKCPVCEGKKFIKINEEYQVCEVCKGTGTLNKKEGIGEKFGLSESATILID